MVLKNGERRRVLLKGRMTGPDPKCVDSLSTYFVVLFRGWKALESLQSCLANGEQQSGARGGGGGWGE